MPKRAIAALLITTGALVLLLSFKTPDRSVPPGDPGVAVVVPATPRTNGGGTQPTSRRATPTPGAATPTPGAGTSAPNSTAKTVDGPVVSTRFGPIQVEVVVGSGSITDIVALQLPTGRRSGQISDYSAPILRQEALQAQSASIDTVSGATYTSDAYARSLQAALDQAAHG